jgi:hypothetical protein
MIKANAKCLGMAALTVLPLCLNYIVFIGLIPFLVALEPYLIRLRVSETAVSLVLSFSFMLTFIATDFLTGFCWKKDCTAVGTLTMIAYIDRVSIFFQSSGFLVAATAKRNKVRGAIITTDANGNFMVNIKSSAILFRCFTAMLANLIPFTNRLRNFSPSITIIGRPTMISRMVFASIPRVPMEYIDKKSVCFIAFYTGFKDAHLFTTSASAIYFYTRFYLNRFSTFLRTAGSDLISSSTIKRLPANYTDFLGVSMSGTADLIAILSPCMAWGNCEGLTTVKTGNSNEHIDNPLVSGYSSIVSGRLVTKPVSSVDDQSTLALSIIPFFAPAYKEEGGRCYD